MMKLLLQLALTMRRLYWRLVRPVTRGVRAILVNPEEKILLLQHKYGEGWILPGGKARKGEGDENTLKRELREELGITDISQITKIGEYQNIYEYKKDTVVVFVVCSFTLTPKRHFEIETWGFFDPRALPEGISPGTRRRIEEWLGQRRISNQW